jgi:tRNA A37 methylthiotransferase MiaB
MIAAIRARDPLASIRTTFILGFPGETDADAAEVEDFVASSDADWIGVFTYSREPGTRSHDMNGHVPAPTARERTERVAAAADEVMSERARRLAGTTVTVLAERLDVGEGIWTGRSHREAPEIDGEISFLPSGEVRVGDYLGVRITGSEGADLRGRAL